MALNTCSSEPCCEASETRWKKQMSQKDDISEAEMNELIMDFFITEGESEFCNEFMFDTQTLVRPRKSMQVRYTSDSKKLSETINNNYYGFDKRFGYYRNKKYLFNKIDIRGQIKQSIINGNALNAIQLLNKHYKNFLKRHKSIEFDLKKSHLVGLIKRGDCMEAIEYATHNIVPYLSHNVCFIASSVYPCTKKHQKRKKAKRKTF